MLCYSLEKYRNNVKVNLKDFIWLRYYVIEKLWSVVCKFKFLYNLMFYGVVI